jgi:PAS domain S-box-containing protein
LSRSVALDLPPVTAASPLNARSWSIEDKVAVAFSLALAGLLVAAALTVQSVFVFVNGSRWVSHTYQVLQTTEATFSALNEAAAAARTYVITGDDRDALLRLEARKKLDASLQQLKVVTADDPIQLQRITELERIIAERRARLDAITAVRNEQGFAAARADIIAQAGSGQNGEVRKRIEEIQATEKGLLKRRQRFDNDQVRRLFEFGAACLVLVLMTVALGVLRLRRELRERRQLIVDVEQSRKFFQSMIESIPLLVYVKRAQDLRIVQMNAASEAITGLPPDAFIGKNSDDMVSPERALNYNRKDLAALSGQGVHDSQDEIVQMKDNTVRTLHTRRIVIRDANERPAYLLSIAEDITDQLAAEKQISSLNADLAQKNLSLEMSNKELESFSYSVSHDLRSPLRAIGSFAQMLEEDYADRLDAEGMRYLGIVRSSTARMNLLIDDLLMYARFGRQALRPSKIMTAALVHEAVRDATQGVGGELPVVNIGALPDCFGDRAVIRQVWNNLISNAIKYSSKRSPARIEVWGESDGRSNIFHVRDNGAGFDMRYYDKLFGVFQRLHSEGEFSGTGVGLAIVQRVVIRHGGRVWGEAEVDKGACFHFSLPIKEVE